MYGRDSPSEWAEALGNFSSQGGKTVWMFGNSLKRTTAAAVRNATATAECMVSGQHCVDYALAAAARHQLSVSTISTYEDYTQFTAAALTPCHGKGVGEIHLPPGEKGGSKHEFWVVVLPRWERTTAERASCEARPGGKVDIVLVNFPNALYTPSPHDGLKNFLAATEASGLEAFVSMPGLPDKPPPDTWSVDELAMTALLGLVNRTSQDLCERGFAGKVGGSLRGVYQGHEMPVSGNAFWVEQYNFYDQAAQVFHLAVGACHQAPPLQFATSPYWSVNRHQNNDTLANSARGIAALAQTAVDIVAPQEGRGTGKAGCYWPHQADELVSAVDSNFGRYANVHGNETFKAQFEASTTELFRAARREVDAANAKRPTPIELWMNLEAFETTFINLCDADTDRTNKTRVDRSLMFAAGYVDQVVSFMWDPYYTCSPPGYDGSLAQDIVADLARPILASAVLAPARTAHVTGWNLCASDARVEVSWPVGAGRNNGTGVVSGCEAAKIAGSAASQRATVALPFDVGAVSEGYVALRPFASGLLSHGEFALEVSPKTDIYIQ
jgi:hypothetical protein